MQLVAVSLTGAGLVSLMALKAPTVVVDGLWKCLCPASTWQSLRVAPRTQNLPRSSLPSRTTQCRVPYAVTVRKRPAPCYSTQSMTRRVPRIPLTIDDPPPASSGVAQQSAETTEERLVAQLHLHAQEANKAKVHELVLQLVKDHAQVPEAAHYEALLLAEADPEHGAAMEVERLLKQLEVDSIPPDSAIYHAALKALAIHPNYVLREKVLTEMEQRWFELNDSGWHSVTAALFRERQVELALERLSQMQAVGYQPQPWLLHLAIATCLSIEAFPEALTLLQHRITSSEPVPSALWSECLQKAAHAFCHPLVDFIWRRAVEVSYLNPSSGTCLAVLDTAARHGDFHLATDVFRVLRKRRSPLKPYHYEALMQAYLNAGELPAAMSVLGLMVTSNLAPDLGTCRPILHFLADDAATRVPHCLALLTKPIPLALPRVSVTASKTKPDHPPTVYPATAFALTVCIEALVAVHALDAARSLLSQWAGYCAHEPPGLPVYNSLLLGVAQLDAPRQRELAAELATEIHEQGLEPDATTWERLLVLHLGPRNTEPETNGLLDALACFEKLTSHSTYVSSATRLLLVSKLARAEQLKAASIVAHTWNVPVSIIEENVDGTVEQSKASGEIVRVDDDTAGKKWVMKEHESDGEFVAKSEYNAL